MKTVQDALTTAIISFVATLALQFGIQYLVQDVGSVRVGPTTTIQGQPYVSMNFVNYTSHPLDNLLVSIPATTPITDIIASEPVQLVLVPDSSGTLNAKRISVAGIAPNRVTELLIPVANQTAVQFVEVINDDGNRLTIENARNVRSPVVRLLQQALLYAVIAAIIVFLAELSVARRLRAVRHRLEEVKRGDEEAVAQAKQEVQARRQELEGARQEQERLSKQVEQVAQESSRLQTHTMRVRLLLLARLTDHEEELRFWRDTVRKMLYQSTHERATAETLIQQVTDTLKTYGTRQSAVKEFETINVLATMLAQQEQNNGHK